MPDLEGHLSTLVAAARAHLSESPANDDDRVLSIDGADLLEQLKSELLETAARSFAQFVRLETLTSRPTKRMVGADRCSP